MTQINDLKAKLFDINNEIQRLQQIGQQVLQQLQKEIKVEQENLATKAEEPPKKKKG